MLDCKDFQISAMEACNDAIFLLINLLQNGPIFGPMKQGLAGFLDLDQTLDHSSSTLWASMVAFLTSSFLVCWSPVTSKVFATNPHTCWLALGAQTDVIEGCACKVLPSLLALLLAASLLLALPVDLADVALIEECLFKDSSSRPGRSFTY